MTAGLKYFIGLENSEVADVTGLSLRTVERDWTYAKAWLSCEIEGISGSGKA